MPVYAVSLDRPDSDPETYNMFSFVRLCVRVICCHRLPKSRHWLIAYTWVSELQKHGILRYKHIYGKLNASDMLAKPVTGKVFDNINDIINKGYWEEIIAEHEKSVFKKIKKGG